MMRLAMILFSLSGTALVGSGVVAALVSGHDDAAGILAGAAIGLALSVPVTLALARRLSAEA